MAEHAHTTPTPRARRQAQPPTGATDRRQALAALGGGLLAAASAFTGARAETSPASVTVPAVAAQGELLNRYSAWLDAEREALMREMYPGWDVRDAMRFVPEDRFVRSRMRRAEPPSGRAVAVLEAAGVSTAPDTLEAREAAWTAPSDHPDAELIACCDAAIRAWKASAALTNHLARVPPDIAVQDEALLDVWERNLHRALALPATTFEGAKAKGRLLHMHAPKNDAGELIDADEAAPCELVAWSMAKDALMQGGIA